MDQLALDLGPAAGSAERVTSRSNAAAFALLDRWPHWPSPVQLVTGPEGSGKTFLAHAFAEATGGLCIAGADLARHDPLTLAEGAVAVDDANAADERALFHLFNAVRAAGTTLVLTAETPFGPQLPDLASRLRQVPEVRLEPPDDALLAGVMREAFTERQLPPDPAVIQFLLPRMERTLHKAKALVAFLDREGLAARRSPTRPFAARILSGSRHHEGVR